MCACGIRGIRGRTDETDFTKNVAKDILGGRCAVPVLGLGRMESADCLADRDTAPPPRL